LGAHASGIRNVLAVTGDPPPPGDRGGSDGVYQVDAIGLTEVIAALNRGVDYSGKSIDAPTAFHIGVAVNPGALSLDLSSSSLSLRPYRSRNSATGSLPASFMLFPPAVEVGPEDGTQVCMRAEVPVLDTATAPDRYLFAVRQMSIDTAKDEKEFVPTDRQHASPEAVQECFG
jgi:hypothetical protein